jgi:hypothetical protein
MKISKITLFGCLLGVILACRFLPPQAQTKEVNTYENDAFSFTIPAGWQMAQFGGNYYGLGVEEIVAIQNRPLAIKSDAFFSVATSPLAGGADLEFRFTQAYETADPEIKEVSKQVFKRGTLAGYEIIYTRPWGEPWWKFHDIWLEKDAVIYVLSFHTPLNAFDNDPAIFDQIIDSFRFKDGKLL